MSMGKLTKIKKKCTEIHVYKFPANNFHDVTKLQKKKKSQRT